jgi:hypothetical protein
MPNRNFADWISRFRESISDYGYYADFAKVHRNVDTIKVELNILNSLIGSANVEADFDALVVKYPETLKCVPLLLAVRANEIYAIDGDGEFRYNFVRPNQTSEQYREKYQVLFPLLIKMLAPERAFNTPLPYTSGSRKATTGMKKRFATGYTKA